MREAVTTSERSVGDTVRVGVAIPAAGSGVRMGGVRKALLELAGEPVLLHAMRPFLADTRVVALCVALPPDDAEAPPRWLLECDPRVTVVVGGATRSESVGRAIQALPDDVTVIAVHDAARPLVTAQVVRTCIDIAATGVGAVSGCPAVDTMKTVGPDGSILSTPERSSIWHAHTPQVFPARALRRAYANGGGDATDDAELVERAGMRVVMVDGGAANIKVTRTEDLVLAEALLRARESL